MRNGRRGTKFVGWKRRLGMAALAAVMATTVSGDNREVTASDLARPLSDVLGRARAWEASATNALTFGILYGTVLSRMEPGMRRSFVAAVEGVREFCTGRPAAPVAKCATKACPTLRTIRCSRA